MVYASLRTDPEDKGPDVMILMPRELATFVGISRDAAGDNCLYDAYVLGGEGLELEGTAEGLAHGTIRILMGLAEFPGMAVPDPGGVHERDFHGDGGTGGAGGI